VSYRDLRGHIDKLEKAGELQRIKVEVDWDLELATILRRVFKLDGPACLFEKVKDSEFPVLAGTFFRHKKYAMMVDAPPNMRDIVDKVLNCINNPIDPVMVNSGACQQNVDTGDKIDLGIFPVPKWHPLDGGRFIGTLGAVITKDPETSIRNVAVYREQMYSKNQTGVNPEQQGGTHLSKYRAMNKPMPVATAIGVPPAVLAAALSKPPYGQDEMGVAGAIAGEPIPLVKCKTVDLEVPADAEIVLEGEVPPDTSEWELEGPLAEFTGHYHTLEKQLKPVVNLTAVTYRNKPIFQGTSNGVPPNEGLTGPEIGGTAGAWQGLQRAGIPGIKEVSLPEWGVGMVVVVSMDRHFYLGNVRQIIYHIFANYYMSKWVIVVDDDVDIYDLGSIQWALATRVQPHRDIIITDNRLVGIQLDPSIHPDIRNIPRSQTSKIGIDATKHFKGFEFGPVITETEEMEQRLNRRWKEYGFKI